MAIITAENESLKEQADKQPNDCDVWETDCQSLKAQVETDKVELKHLRELNNKKQDLIAKVSQIRELEGAKESLKAQLALRSAENSDHSSIYQWGVEQKVLKSLKDQLTKKAEETSFKDSRIQEREEAAAQLPSLQSQVSELSRAKEALEE
ncbi:hypothetical protein K469DRAFT_693982 [Zopfia rhizophila CBS 207.26]|uniref:Uncharacterized protein n=1 Tax=Zopfia rhizophila CBS 207.26 TaxID=1314779 RepID=A0A6A6DP94_9PEZI|nr:hypothetical protein K469DRAFT_693982 [Zopfia rhizophila CBS 207.26]